jgi:hypothetical protein
VLRLWFGISDRVGPGAYALSGFALMALKYAGEALAIWWYTSAVLAPWNFVNPLLSVRTEILRPAPEWLAGAIFVWTLPFLWIAISMSVRRAADAGASPWTGLAVLIPIINLLVMLALCLAPSRPGDRWAMRSSPTSDEQRAKSAAIGVGISLIIGAVMLLVSVYLFQIYGASLFLGTPILMGAAAGYMHNREHPRGFGASAGVGLASILFAGLALLLFALEGLICVAMAAPLFVPLGVAGGVIGKVIAEATRRPARELTAAVLVLPLLAGVEALAARSSEYVVTSAVEIEAPPEVVWENVIDFPELTETPAWYFRFGIACPQRARIVGTGVGATRYCEFTTGAFVEPITVWEAPRRLAFDVTEQPAPMFELSPYRHVHPPHLDGYLRSDRGEFLLVPLEGGRTRLEGRTWYEFHMFPQSYWTIWSDWLIHRIHERVLRHVKALSERRAVAYTK